MSNLAIACELSLNEWIATFPDEFPEAERSKKHEKWKKKLFDKMRDDHYHRFTSKSVKIMLVAAIISILLLTAFVIPSSREFILDNFDRFSRYELTENNDNYVTGEIKVGYIPEGFELLQTNDSGKYILSDYENNNGVFFTIYKYSSSMKLEFDTENYISEEITLNGIQYVYCNGNFGIDNLIWTKNDYVYRIDGNISFEEFIKIAEKVE